MSYKKSNLLPAVFVAILVAISIASAQGSRPQHPPRPHHDMAESWRTEVLSDGNISMSMSANFGAVDRTITMVVSSSTITPQSGTCVFPNGFRREMTSGEIRYFWTNVGGAPAAWQHLQKAGRLETIRPAKGEKIPANWYNKWAVAVMANNKHHQSSNQMWHVGQIQKAAEGSINLSVNNMGLPTTTPLKPLPIETQQILELHVLK